MAYVSSEFCPKPIYHFAWVFPEQNIEKDVRHAQIYRNVPEYQEKMRIALKNKEVKAYPRTEFDDFPKLARRFIGKARYDFD